MKKHLQSGWMRALSQVICIISIFCMAFGAVGFVAFTEYEGAEGIYQEGFETIAENYALYSVDMIQQGREQELNSFLKENNIVVRATYLDSTLVDGEEIIVSEQLLYSSVEPMESNKETILVADGSRYGYAKNSLLAMLTGSAYHYADEKWVEYPIIQVVYDPGRGLFLFETEAGYFKVPEVKIYVDNGTYIDYVLKNINGTECYYNGYYDVILDPLSCADWKGVVISGYYVRLQAYSEGASEWIGDILVVPDNHIPEISIVKGEYSINSESIHTRLPEDSDYYQVEISWGLSYGKDNRFSEWTAVCDALKIVESYVMPILVMGCLLFIVSFAALLYSSNSDKEKMGIMSKSPVLLYTACMVSLELALGACIVACYQWIFFSDKGKFFNVIGILLFLVAIMIWLFLIWIQNIASRIKCKSFWKTTDIYYLYLLTKKSSSFMKNLFKKATNIIALPFRKIGGFIKLFAHQVGKNTPLMFGSFVVFVVVAIIDFGLGIKVAWGGENILFFVILKLIEATVLFLILVDMQKLHEASKRLASGDMSNPIDTTCMHWKFKEHAENINKVSDGIALAVEERIKSERFKTELITNVSHDIKTPLTSIINYVDLMKKENLEDEKIQGYIEVLDRQSARLKKLIEDLMEASKASTGNLAVNLEECDLSVLLSQVVGEFEEKLQKNQLEIIVDKPELPVNIMADGRHMWRVLDNLLNNACKYSLPGTRIYVTLKQETNDVVMTFKNISKDPLNIPSEELMERFVRGDSSRNTEGSGLGLSIAQSLTELMNGTLKLEIDGDLFKVTLRFSIK